MNYRHAFHAGSFADVLKHSVLALILGHLRRKETPFCVLDTHAGAGRYDLTGDEASRTGEWRDGVARLAAGGPTPLLDDYLAALRAANPAWPSLRAYPGSPAVTRSLLRDGDRLVAVERHPEEVRILRRAFAGERQVGVHEGDGYEALRAHLPPKERRGLVLIDPPFEEPKEFERLGKALPGALRRWPRGIYAIWYPIKDPAPVERFRAEISGLGWPALAAELHVRRRGDPARLNGAGMAIVNPPWKFDAALEELLPLVASRLGAADARVLRLTGESEV